MERRRSEERDKMVERGCIQTQNFATTKRRPYYQAWHEVPKAQEVETSKLRNTLFRIPLPKFNRSMGTLFPALRYVAT